MDNDQLYKVLTIAGFDGSGGAGILADLKTFSALGCYGMSVLTALTAQNTMGVRSINEIPAKFVGDQLQTIFDDIPVDTLKIGMLHRREVIEVVSTILHDIPGLNIVLDPVMVARSGNRLLLPSAIQAMKKELFPITTVLTPNLSEASEILGRKIQTKSQMKEAAQELAHMGPKAVVVKGGHLDDCCDDCLCIGEFGFEIHWFNHSKIPTRNTHGTGCTLSAAIAAFLSQGLTILEAVYGAKQYVTGAIAKGAHLRIGEGNGPVHHFHHLWKGLMPSCHQEGANALF